MNKALKDKIKGIIKNKVLFDEAMDLHTSFRIGGPAEAWVEPGDLKSLVGLVKFARKEGIPLMIIGAGSNILVRDEGIKGIVVNLSSDYFKRIDVDQRRLRAWSGLEIVSLLRVMVDKELAGLEFMADIPGTVGGAVMMNAGRKDRAIGDLISSVEVIDGKGEVFKIGKREIKFGYRFSGLDDYIILSADFNLNKRPSGLISRQINKYAFTKRNSQELKLPSAGSVFKNPTAVSSASARLIELSGLKGKRLGNARVSFKHANFIVNLDKARARDVIGLIELIKSAVKRDHGVNLELEIKII
ncbi:MAG: UDP-N-acetylmuramate dehydrogenase [Candidatus Omnitrophota bacterium]|nr:UDP-N-acetylmuramate dehydrogenase [Candidatus Omnitrophota bacterium]